MKKIVLSALVFMAISTVAQVSARAQQTPGTETSSKVVEASEAPSYNDIYCAGFLTNEKFNPANQIVAGEYAPNQTLNVANNMIFVSGSGYQPGAKYSVIRALHDPNKYEPYKGQRHDVNAAGQPYAQLGQIQIVTLRGQTAVAQVTFSCQPMTTGDLVVPFQEHPPVAYKKHVTIQRFPASQGKLTARIVMSNEFDFSLATGQKVFINAGSDQGVKVGDYFRAVRGYAPHMIDPVEKLSYKAPVGEDTQLKPGKVTPEMAKELPVRTLGELIVINVTPTSSTAMITSSLESIEVGDKVELENEQ
jgi:hypothetical protein